MCKSLGQGHLIVRTVRTVKNFFTNLDKAGAVVPFAQPCFPCLQGGSGDNNFEDGPRRVAQDGTVNEGLGLQKIPVLFFTA